MDTRKPYPTDASDAEWRQIEPLLPSERPAGMPGRPRRHTNREIVNALAYLLKTGCQWRQLPHDFPPYTTVSDYYHRWRRGGTLDRLLEALRARVRQREGREPTPSAVIVDSQSVRADEKRGGRNPATLSATTRASTSRAASAT